MNILHESAINECTSCQMCGAVCRANAITIHLNNDGFYRPSIDNDKCTDCGQCINVCHKFDNSIQKTSNDKLDQCLLFAASAKNDEIVANTTSGGIADLLARQLISDGYKVIGVVYDYSINRAKHQIATTIEDAVPFRGSKYIQAYSLDAFRELVNECRRQPFAVFGLPCQIYAISRFLEKKGLRKQCTLIDLYCHGCPSMDAWDKTVSYIQNKLGTNQFDKVCFRSKLKGWGKFVVEVRQGKQLYYSTPLHNGFYDLFFSDQVLNNSCANCELRSTLHYTDIRLGDFWGRKYKKDLKGVSGITIVSDSAKELFTKISPYINYKKESLGVFLPYQSWGKSYAINHALRNELLRLLHNNDKTLDDAIKPLIVKRTIKKKVKLICKQLFFFIPSSFYTAPRHLYTHMYSKLFKLKR